MGGIGVLFTIIFNIASSKNFLGMHMKTGHWLIVVEIQWCLHCIKKLLSIKGTIIFSYYSQENISDSIKGVGALPS